jgi:hypothetical protein
LSSLEDYPKRIRPVQGQRSEILDDVANLEVSSEIVQILKREIAFFILEAGKMPFADTGFCFYGTEREVRGAQPI